jgi:hypothetical protein
VYSSNNMISWSNISANNFSTTSKWSQRRKPETVYFSNKYWVFGGNIGSPAILPDTNDIWSSPDGVTWTKVGNAPFSGNEARVMVLGSKLYMIDGGFQLSNIPAKVWSSTDGKNWTLVNGNAPFSARDSFMTATFNSKMYVMGGASWTTCCNSDVWSSPDGVTWTKVTSTAPWGKLKNAKAFVFNGKMYMFGGFVATSGGASVSLNGWSTTNGTTWVKTTSNLPLFNGSSFNDVDGVVANGKLWLSTFASTSGGEENSLWCSADGISWNKSNTKLPWSPRYSYRMISNGGTPAGGVNSSCNLN